MFNLKLKTVMKMRLPLFFMTAAIATVGFAGVKDAAGRYSVSAAGNQAAVALDNKAGLMTPSVKVKNASQGHKILKKETLKDGSVLNYVQVDGKIVKMLSAKNGKIVKRLSNSIQKVAAGTESGSTAVESFEGWDGSTPDWIPNGWTDVSAVGSSVDGDAFNEYNLTWEVGGESVYSPEPTDGEYFASVQFALLSAQDETLTSTAFTAVSGQYLMVDINYSPGFYRLDLMNMPSEENPDQPYVFDQKHSNLEISISADNGTSWTKVFDVLEDDASKYSQVELENDLYTYYHPWTTAVIDLAQYAGQSIKVAFRYTNDGMGESVRIDNVRIGYPAANVSYSYPSGAFLLGFTQDYGAQTASEILLPPYVDLVWTNNSSYVTSSQWEYVDLENSTSQEVAYGYSDDWDLTTNYDPSNLYVPFLQYTNYKGDNLEYYPTFEAQASETETALYPYNTTYGGGTTKSLRVSGSADEYVTMTLGAGNYDLNKQFSAIVVDEAGTQYLFGTGGDAIWANALGDENVKVIGVANTFSKPATPYSFTTLWVNGEFEGSAGATFTLNIYEVDEETGLIQPEPIETSTATMQDIIETQIPTQTGYVTYKTLPFVFKEQVGSLKREKDVEIDSEIFVELTFDNNVTTFAPYMQLYPNEDESCYAYVALSTSKGKAYYASSSFGTSLGPLYSAFLFNMDATYSWMRCDESAFVAPVSGGEKSFTVESYKASSAWTVEGDAVVGNSDNAWIDWAAEDVLIEEAGQQYYTGETTLVLTADPLPAGVTGRSAEVTVSIPGASKTFYVQQGEAGVEAVETSANRVSVVNGNFEVEAASATSVDVYNVAGQKVASAAIEGTTVVPAQDLAKGLYILKFNDNTAVKVMK